MNEPLDIRPRAEDPLEQHLSEVQLLLSRYRRVEDMVERRTAELSAAKEVAEAANRTKSAFLANANLSGADLTDANLVGATLDGVTWSNTTCPNGSVTNSGC